MELVRYRVITPQVDRTNRYWDSASLLARPLDVRPQTLPWREQRPRRDD